MQGIKILKLKKFNWRKILVVFSVFTTLILLPLAIYIYMTETLNASGWYSDSWMYRKVLSVSNDTMSELTDEDILLEINTQTLVDQGKLQTDCDDLRFVDSDDSSILDYYIESGCNTSNTKVWVRIPSLPSSGKDLYMYYGNETISGSTLTWSGNAIMFSEGSCPTGWTRASDLDGKFLMGSDTYGVTGGITDHSHDNAFCTSSSISTTNISGEGSGPVVGTTSTHTHSSLQASLTGVTDTVPPYMDMVLCYKNDFVIPQGLISMYSGSIASDWSRFSSLDNRFPRANSSYGSTGGTSTHTHSTTVGNITSTPSTTLGTGVSFSASGGTVTTIGDDKVHAFTSNGTFTTNMSLTAKVLVVAGGGGGGNDIGGGGGGGGVLYSSSKTLSSGSISANVGNGGARYSNGQNSSFVDMVAIGGGRGGQWNAIAGAGGGSGGGASGASWNTTVNGGSGTSGQGYRGGKTTWRCYAGAGGGGASGIGENSQPYINGGDGGNGVYYGDVFGTNYGENGYFGGGGGGGCGENGGPWGSPGAGGLGGGGNGAPRNGDPQNGIPNTGGGGGGERRGGNYGGAGGSGIVLIRYTPPLNQTYASSTHTHTSNSASVSSVSNMPPYLTMQFAKADTQTYVDSNTVVPVTEIPPLGWSRYTSLDNKFALASDTYGNSGGSSTHTHSVEIETGGPSATVEGSGSGSNYADSTHTHSCTVDTNTASNIPPYYSVIYAQRKTSQDVTILGEEINNFYPTPPTNLLVEGATNPELISTLTPSFTATFNDDDVDDIGTYYQIQINSNEAFDGDMIWDTTQTQISPSVDNGTNIDAVEYSGPALEWDTEYYWRIRFWDQKDGEGQWSSVGSFSTLSVPEAPTILDATAIDIDTIRWNFTDNSDIEDGFVILDSEDNLIKTCEGENLTYCEETGLDENTEYTRKISAYNIVGRGTSSATTTAFTKTGTPEISLGGSVQTNSIVLQATGRVNGSPVKFECLNDNCSSGISTWVSGDQATVTNLQPNTGYTFRVKGRNGGGVESGYSEQITVHTLAEVPSIDTSAISPSAIELSATNVNNLDQGDSGIHFECEEANCSDGITEWLENDSATVNNLEPNTQYFFRVKAKNYDGIQTSSSLYQGVYTHANVPSLPKEKSRDLDSVTIKIEADDNPIETEYLILEEVSGKYLDYNSNQLVVDPVWGTRENFGLESGVTVGDLNSGVEYKFKVMARNGDDIQTDYSDSLSIPTKLIIPTALTSSNVETQEVKWRITDLNENESGYKIYDEKNNLIATCLVENNFSDCTEQNLEANTKYYRKARSFNTVSESDYTNLVSFVTHSRESKVELASKGYNSVRLGVDADTNDRVQIQETNSKRYYDGNVETLRSGYKTNDYEDEITVYGLVPNTAYGFKVRSLNQENVATTWSKTISLTTLAQKPTLVEVERVSSNSVRIYIDINENPQDTLISVKESNSGKYLDYTTKTLVNDTKWGKISDFGGTSGLVINNLEVGKQYGFAVRAKNSENEITEWSKTFFIGTASVLKNLKEGLQVVLVEDENVNVSDVNNAQYGEKKVRVKKQDLIVADLPVSFEVDRDWSDLVIDTEPEEYKTVVKVKEDHGVLGAFTMYIVKGNTNAVRICPHATNLEEVTENCLDEKLLEGEFPQTVEVEGAEVVVSNAVVDQTEYWIADGLRGTGVEGVFRSKTEEKVSEDSPKLPFLTDDFPHLVLANWYYLFVGLSASILIVVVVLLLKRKNHYE